MKIISIAILALFALTVFAQTESSSESNSPLTFLRETNDLPGLESVIYNEETDLLYVSLQRMKGGTDGSIATVSLDGDITDLNFAIGLVDPKGMAIVGDLLYVSDVLYLVEIDLITGKILNKYTREGVRYFNDVTADKKGNVYVSDMHASSIYKLDTDKNLTEWVASPALESPNGLLIVGEEMLIGGWGYFNDGNALNAPIGNLLTMDVNTMVLSKITSEPIGNIDAIQVFDKNSYLITDWKEGKVFRVYKDGSYEELLDTERGAADALLLPNKKLFILPLNKEDKLAFYTVDFKK